MAGAKVDSDWDRTASSLCLLANIYRDKKLRPKPYNPWDFHPKGKARKPIRESPVAEVPITALRDVFIDGVMPESQGGNP